MTSDHGHYLKEAPTAKEKCMGYTKLSDLTFKFGNSQRTLFHFFKVQLFNTKVIHVFLLCIQYTHACTDIHTHLEKSFSVIPISQELISLRKRKVLNLIISGSYTRKAGKSSYYKLNVNISLPLKLNRLTLNYNHHLLSSYHHLKKLVNILSSPYHTLLKQENSSNEVSGNLTNFLY